MLHTINPLWKTGNKLKIKIIINADNEKCGITKWKKYTNEGKIKQI